MVKIEEANVGGRRARLEAMRKAREQEEELDNQESKEAVEVVMRM